MDREWTISEKAERSIHKKYRDTLWTPFLRAIKQYNLLQEGDRIAVCISGGKDSMLLAKLMQMLQRYSDYPFEVVYLVMDPGYSPANRAKIEENAKKLEIPIRVFETNIFDVADKAEKSPCYLCAKMRRGYLYKNAKEAGCNKIALGHHLSDVIETTLMGMFYSSQLATMAPKLHSKNFEGMELIRPLYGINEKDIISWAQYNQLEFLRCACKLTEREAGEEILGKRQEVKRLIAKLKEENPDIEKSLFNALHAVEITTFPGYKKEGVIHTFLEEYDED